MRRLYRARDPYASGPTEHRGATPGKRTRTEILHREAAPRDRANAARDDHGVMHGAETAVATASASEGAPLPERLQHKFESSLGADLGGVRIHSGADSAGAAHSVGARAYTVGQDIHFAAGEYRPDSHDGERLLAHEVAHTVQQTDHGQPRFKLEVSTAGDAAEVEADRAAEAMIAARPAGTIGSGQGVQRQEAAPAEEGAAPKATPVWVDFKNGKWDGKSVLANLEALTSVPADLRAAILAGAKETGKFCLDLRARVDLAASLDPARRAEHDKTSRALTSRATELYYASAQSPLEYRQLVDVAGWAIEFAQPAPGVTPAAPAEGASEESSAAAPPAAEPAEKSAGEKYRAAFLETLDYYKNSTEKGVGRDRFKEIMGDLNPARISNPGFTGCNTFSDVARSRTAQKQGIDVAKIKFASGDLWRPETRAKLPPGAWHDCTPDGDRPKPGDVLVMLGLSGAFAHVSNFVGLERTGGSGAPERWKSVDGGQGTAAVYDAANAKFTTEGNEAILEVDYAFFPTTPPPATPEGETGGIGKYALKAANALNGKTCVVFHDHPEVRFPRAKRILGWVDVAVMADAAVQPAPEPATE